MDQSVERIVELVSGRVGQLAVAAGPERTLAMMRLVLRHWPHEHLRILARAGGKHHADLVHVGRLLRCQVREQWEARHGISPSWLTTMSPLLDAMWLVVVEDWWRDKDYRVTLRVLSQRIVDKEA